VSDKFLDKIITDKPLEFSFDQDTGLVTLVVHAGFGPPDSPTPSMHIPIRIMLTTESSRALLVDLPKLAEILDKAKQGITKPRFLQ
jgi:hypothetical protein